MENEKINKNNFATVDAHVLETLICLEYLIKYTSKKHPTKQSDIVKYALDNYKTTTRRDRIGHILTVLYDNSESINSNLGIKIEKVENLSSEKYFVSKRYIDNDKVKQIMTSVAANPGLSDKNKDILNDIVFNLTHTKDDLENKKKIELEVAKEKLHHINFTRNELRFFERLKPILNNYPYLKITLKEKFYKTDVKQEFYDKYYLEGRLYQIFDLKERLYMYLISSKNGKLLSIKLDDILSIKIGKEPTTLTKLNKMFNQDGYSDIQEYIDSNNGSMNSYAKQNLIFKIYKSPDYEYVRNQYMNIFGSDFNIVSTNAKKTEQQIEICADPYLIYLFLWDVKVLFNCKIIEPQSCKDLILSHLKKVQKNLI